MAQPAKELTTRQIVGVRFGFYTDEEVRKLSVKRIVSPLIFDNLKNPVLEGLYDPALGPIDPRGCCSTCNLTQAYCPGHFGHIELPLPVYNPLIFSTLYRLLRNTCFYCFHFRMGREEMSKFVAKLQKLLEGDLVGSSTISLGKGLDADFEDLLPEDLAEGLKGDSESTAERPRKGKGGGSSCKAGQARAGGSAGVVLTSTALVAMRELITEFYARVPKGRCANCGAHSPVVKKQGHTKLFKMMPSTKAMVQNQMRGIDVMAKTAMAQAAGPEQTAALEAEMVADEAKAKGKREERKREREDEDGPQPLMGDELKAPEEDVDETDEEDEDGAGTGKPAASRSELSKKATLAAEADVAAMDFAPKYMTPLEAEETMKRLWTNEAALLTHLYAAEVGSLDMRRASGACGRSVVAVSMPKGDEAQGYHMFFLRTLPIAPNKFRPPSKVGEEMFEHAQNVTLAKVLTMCLELTTLQAPGGQTGGGEVALAGQVDLGRNINQWLQLQNSVAALMDSTAADNAEGVGIRQVLEKKEGLFRKNMMGKRVNFAARSVISPDPYIGAGEIGVPPYFAKRLSFPERVTPWNVERLREAVIRGCDEMPGAVAVEDERGRLVNLATQSKQRREAIAKQLLSGVAAGVGSSGRHVSTVAAAATAAPHAMPAGPGKIVYRHLRDGDLMLTNRQPTLHKPGLMAHRARVLKGERTIRMHYANCATFNADFDGDEINLHLPQDQLARAEGYNIVHADQQYIVPTDGKPIRGLIQDHVDAACLLTSRDCFFDKEEYTQLMYVACSPWTANQGLGLVRMHDEPLVLEPPTILAPRQLWTGKQVISNVVRHLTRGMAPLTFSSKAQVPAEYWGGKNSGESELVFQKGYLMSGCFDKKQFGKYGLVHAVQELYSNRAAGELLNAFSRVFTHFLQWHGMTCGFDDLLLVPEAEARRTALLDSAEARAIAASAEFVQQSVPEHVLADPARYHKALMAAEHGVRAALAERYRANAETGKGHDMKGSGAMHKLGSAVVGTTLPSGQIKAFPKNCLSLMTVTGAKGSQVNFSQISCLLGQQELEGRRPPRCSSGKTLPCFRPFDAGARSCGFVGDRFLTGLRPQEYYFHCMAGREGLVDTAVKTSRSGYLQRCLVKNLETLRVHYDSTVRDNADGSVVQLFYGEDGLDVMGVSFMHQFGFLAHNAQRFAQQLDLEGALKVSKVAGLKSEEKAVRKAIEERTKALAKVAAAAVQAVSGSGNRKLAKAQASLDALGLPLMSSHPPSVLGAVSEAFLDALVGFVDRNPGGVLLRADSEMHSAPSPLGSGKLFAPRPEVESETFIRLMQLKFMRSQAAAGEAVGVLAAQSVGEPSTQMTLNTFHMAGRGEANVTLGIPRLREILMTAAPKIKTPVMTLALLPSAGLPGANTLANRLRKLRLAECLSGMSVEETPVARVEGLEGGFGRVYECTLQFFAPSLYPKESGLSFDDLAHTFTAVFCSKLKTEIEKESKKRAGGSSVGRIELSTLKGEEEEATGAGTGGAADEDAAPASAAAKNKKSDKDDDFEDAEEDEKMREGADRFCGGRIQNT
ncbi:hypothetical protein FOA52_004627 [Chlamydomonas sp. UWO 241]|nr:hypothetical protein FOA52_004627 [Chlamydomonas sp. UWO 241]